MILLQDAVEMEASPDQIFDWLAHFPENYLAWHPDHVACWYLKGTSLLEVGSVLYIEEYLHGERHSLKLRTTRVLPNSRLEYRAGFGIRGAFEVRPQAEGMPFVAELALGSSLPLLGSLVGRVMYKELRERLDAMRQHMSGQGLNLKRWFEKGASAQR